MRQRKTPYNSTFAIGGVSCFADTFVQAESFVLRINICAKKPAHRKSAKRDSSNLADIKKIQKRMRKFLYISITFLILGCNVHEGKQTNNLELLDKETNILYSEMDRYMTNCKPKAKPYYNKAQAIKMTVAKIFGDSTSRMINISDLNELKSVLVEGLASRNPYSQNLKKITVDELDSLNLEFTNKNSEIILEKVKLLEIFALENLISSINYNDFRFDELNIYTTKKTVKKGEEFSTEIIPCMVNNFQESGIVIGNDSIVTSTDRCKGVFETKDYKIGLNKIPARYLVNVNGRIVTIPFDIEFEAK